MGGTTVAWVLPNGDAPIVIQSVLDSIMPKMIPLLITLGLYWLIAKKNFSVVKCIFLLLAVGLIGALPFIGMFA